MACMAQNRYAEHFCNDVEGIMPPQTHAILSAKATCAVIAESPLWTRSGTDISTVNQCVQDTQVW